MENIDADRSFSLPEESANQVGKTMRTGSGIGGSIERSLRETIENQLGLNPEQTTSPEKTVIGTLLIGYITVSTRLIGIQEGLDPEAIRRRVLECLRIPSGGTPQITSERLLNIAIENSRKINTFR